MAQRTRGFTMIEILVVITIISVLMGMAVLLIGPALGTQNETITKQRIQEIAAELAAVRSPTALGMYPPTDVKLLKGPKGEDIGRQVGAGNELNRGIESVYVTLNLPSLGRYFELDGEDPIQNTDDDQAPKQVVTGSSAELFEYVDAWGNPLVYFHAKDYKKPDGFMKVKLGEADGSLEVTARPWKDEKTGRFKLPGEFQLFSAGPDGMFNTEDDIGNW